MPAIRRYLANLLLIASLATLGCGEVVQATDAGGDGDGDDDGGAGTIDATNEPDSAPPDPCADDIAAEDLMGCFQESLCSLYVRCFAYFETVDACLQSSGFFGGDMTQGLKRILDAIDANRITLDGQKAAACMEGIRTVECHRIFNDGFGSQACEETFNGTIGDGNTCYTDQECQHPDADCPEQNTDCEAQCCAGLCEEPVGLNADCTNADCVDGTHCVTTAAAGSTCLAGELNDACNSDFDCDPELWCDESGGSPGQCKEDFASGASCTDNDQCPDPETCVGENTSSGTGTCQEVKAAGDSCDGSCFHPLLWCDQGGDTTTIGICKDLPDLNENCSPPGDCRGLLLCDESLATPICVERQAENESCSDTDECELGLHCTCEIAGTCPGTCKPPQNNGALCTRDGQCQSGICADDDNDNVDECTAYASCY